MTVKIQFRRGAASAWTSADTTLSAGEPGFETDTGKFKVGDGSLSWTALPYAAGLESLRLQDLTNVSATAPTNGQVLTWNTDGSTWQPTTPSGGGGSVNIDDLLDVNVVGTPSTGQVLKWDGTFWTNGTDATGGGGGGAVNIDDLLDVNVIGTPSTGQVLKWDGTFWTNGTDDAGGGGSTSELVNGAFTFELDVLGHIKMAADAESNSRMRGTGGSYPWLLAGLGDTGGVELSWVNVDPSADAGGVTPGAGDIFHTGTTLNTLYINQNGLTVRLDANNVGYQNWQFNTDGTTDFPGFTMPATDGTIGQILTTDGAGNVAWDDPAVGGFTRTTAVGTTSSLNDGATGPINITGFKSYSLLKVQTSAASWVRIYVSESARQADASRAEGVDPSPGAGVIAEIITTGAETILISPATIGFNDDDPVTTDIPVRVTNKSGSTATITVTLTLLQLEV